VCDLLDRKFVKYVGMEKDPKKVIQARNKGLPVFFGDVGRQEVAEAFKVGKAKVNYILAEKRRELLSGKELERFEEESVMTQLGMEIPEDEDETDASDSNIVDETSDTSKVDLPEPEVGMKPLLKQVVEANMAPAPKKKEVKDELEEVVTQSSDEEESEIREKELEKL
jgi:hypothetical protein